MVNSNNQNHHTVNVEIFAQYIFSRISHRALDARKYDVRGKMNHYRSNRNTQKFVHAKMSHAV